jgi:hypothetical protein
VQTWLDQLLNDNPDVGFEATGHLQNVLRLPPGGDSYFKKAAIKFSSALTVSGANKLLDQICLNCRRIQTNDAIDALVVIAKSLPTDLEQTRQMAVFQLGEVPGERAEKELVELAANKNSTLSGHVMSILSRRHQPVTEIETKVRWAW